MPNYALRKNILNKVKFVHRFFEKSIHENKNGWAITIARFLEIEGLFKFTTKLAFSAIHINQFFKKSQNKKRLV